MIRQFIAERQQLNLLEYGECFLAIKTYLRCITSVNTVDYTNFGSHGNCRVLEKYNQSQLQVKSKVLHGVCSGTESWVSDLLIECHRHNDVRYNFIIFMKKGTYLYSNNMSDYVWHTTDCTRKWGFTTWVHTVPMQELLFVNIPCLFIHCMCYSPSSLYRDHPLENLI